MNFFSEIKFARQVRAGEVTENQKFVYFFSSIFFTMLARGTPYVFSYAHGTISKTLIEPSARFLSAGYFFLGFIVTIIGTLSIMYYFYKVNTRGDGINFIERFICGNFLLCLRWCMIIFLCYFLITAALKIFPDNKGNMMILIIGLGIVLFVIGIIKAKRKLKNAPYAAAIKASIRSTLKGIAYTILIVILLDIVCGFTIPRVSSIIIVLSIFLVLVMSLLIYYIQRMALVFQIASGQILENALVEKVS